MKAVLVALLLAACAHTPELAVRPVSVDGAQTETLTLRDRTQLFVVRWRPATEPRGVVVITHGLEDHALRYAAFATQLTAAGYAVYAYDLRGHAHSSGARVAPPAWLDYVGDLDEVLALVRSREAGRPLFVFGHSMGGAIATLAAMKHPPAGLILSAPALAVDAPPLLIAATRLAGVLTPRAKALDLPSRDFSSDPAVVKALDADAMVSHVPGPARTAAGLLDGMQRIWARTRELTFPLLALHGTRDALTSPEGSRALVAAAPSTDKTLRIYEGLWHDLLHEPRGAEVATDILAWLDAHTGGDPVTAPPLYRGTLRGEPRGWSQAVEIGAGIVTEPVAFAGSLSVQLARPRPLGWHGGLTAQWAGDYKAVSLRPLGVAVRLGGAVVGASGGGSLVTGGDFAVSFGAWAEIPLGPMHLGVLAERQRQIANTHDHGPLASDQLWTSVSLRYGRDRAYWPHTIAGVGPVLTGGALWLGDDQTWFATVGLQLYGAD